MEKILGKNSVAALATLAHAQLMDGQVGLGLAALAQARQRTGVDADQDSVTRLALTEADANVKLNRLEDATTDGLAEWQRLQTNGLTDTYVAAMLLSSVAEALRGRGQIDQLHRIVEPLTTDQTVGPASWKMHEQRCWVDLYAGRLDEVTDRVGQILSRSCQRSFYDRSDIAQLRLELALWRHKPRAAVNVVLPVVESMAGATDDGWAARLLTSAMWACADLVEDGGARRDDTQVRAGRLIAERLQAAPNDLPTDPFAQHPFFLTNTVEGQEWTAELHRCQGDNQPELWLTVAREWDTFNRPHRAGYAYWRAAQALLHDGHRGPAASALQTARQRSDQHGPLTDAITDLARLARVALQPPTTPAEASNPMPASPPALGLTSRELDVLRLLTQGLTNAEIGARLYMSPKTASVHVTAILRKLHATNRVQAAAIAERLGLTST
jgi:DNA-binding CsgD family transcriptional regulator